MKNNKTVSEYISSFPDNVQSVLKKIEKAIQEVVPMGEEVISYGIPAFRVDGKNLVFFAGWKEHVSVYPIPPGPNSFKKKIAPFVKGKGTLQFQLGEPIPYNLIKDIVKFGLKRHVEQYKKKVLK